MDRDLLKTIMETSLLVAIPGLYTIVDLYVAIYLNAMYSGTGLVIIFVGLIPMIAIWAKVVHKREKNNMEAQIKSFKVSPELHERALRDYLSLVQKKEEQEPQEANDVNSS